MGEGSGVVGIGGGSGVLTRGAVPVLVLVVRVYSWGSCGGCGTLLGDLARVVAVVLS